MGKRVVVCKTLQIIRLLFTTIIFSLLYIPYPERPAQYLETTHAALQYWATGCNAKELQ